MPAVTGKAHMGRKRGARGLAQGGRVGLCIILKPPTFSGELQLGREGMRKLAIAILATAAMLLAGSVIWTVDATTGAGTQSLPTAAKNYSIVETVACRVSAACPRGSTLVCRPLWRCWCARCR